MCLYAASACVLVNSSLTPNAIYHKKKYSSDQTVKRDREGQGQEKEGRESEAGRGRRIWEKKGEKSPEVLLLPRPRKEEEKRKKEQRPFPPAAFRFESLAADVRRN